MFYKEGNALCWSYNGETLRIEPWGANSLRVRAWKHAQVSGNCWALEEDCVKNPAPVIRIEEDAAITNGSLRAELDTNGRLAFYRGGSLILEEYFRKRTDRPGYTNPFRIEGRMFKGLPGGDYELTVRFEANKGEKLYGMGQYQQDIFDLKGATLELAHRNAQASVPFAVSSLGYGFLWNNPAIGEVHFGTNLTTWKAASTKEMDYWVTAGDTPDQIMRQYADVTGKAPMMPDYAMGFWQCKLRYQTQEELLEVARTHKKKGIPISVIVIDYFHWPHHGDWDYDFEYWPDPVAMAKELHDMGIKLMISIWPTVETDSVNFKEMEEKGLLIRTERGVPFAMINRGNSLFFDATNPASRKFIWDTAKKNYLDRGVDLFWLDEAEPEYTVYDYENYRYYLGPNLQVGNLYPKMYSKAFYDGMTAEGNGQVINLVRCAWAGSQKYGALVWSGDVHSSFRAFRDQVTAGLHMGMSGIPWWTTDIAGFQGGEIETPEFRELLVRWFAYGAFSPVMRLHGVRSPRKAPLSDKGGGLCPSGAENEVWSFGPEIEEICVRYINLREALRPYVKTLMEEAHTTGRPVMRPLFYEFTGDQAAWVVGDQYLFGSDILVAPVLELGAKTRDVYLPAGEEWIEVMSGKQYSGGRTVTVDAPLDSIPLFARKSAADMASMIRGKLYKNG